MLENFQRLSPVSEQGSEIFLFTALMTSSDLIQVLEDSEEPWLPNKQA